MAENQKNQQGTGSQTGKQQNPNERTEGNPSERKPDTGKDEGQGSKMPGRESRTPVAEQDEENTSQGRSGEETGRQGTSQDRNRDANRANDDDRQGGNRKR